MKFCVAWLLLSLTLIAAEDPVPAIRLPISKVPVVPTAVTELMTDSVFVIEADLPCIVLASREGFVTVVNEVGPLRIRGLFADGAGKTETRTYTAKNLWIIEAASPGEVELLVIPTGAKDASVVIRRTLVVSGEGPRPPPPVPPKPPEPLPPAPQPVVNSFRVIFVKESGSTLSAAQTAIPGAKAVRDYLFAKTTREDNVTGWREYDPQTDAKNEQPTMRALWEAVKPKITVVPCVVVEVNGKVEILPYPANVADALVLLKKAGG